MFCPSRLFRAALQPAHTTPTPLDVPWSPPLATHRAAKLKSGSPPGVRSAQPSVFLSHPSSALAFLGYSSSRGVVRLKDRDPVLNLAKFNARQLQMLEKMRHLDRARGRGRFRAVCALGR